MVQMHAAALYKYVLSHSVSTVTKTDELFGFFLSAAHIKSRQNAVQLDWLWYTQRAQRTMYMWTTTAPEILSKYIVTSLFTFFCFQLFDRKRIIVCTPFPLVSNLGSIDGRSKFKSPIDIVCVCVCARAVKSEHII